MALLLFVFLQMTAVFIGTIREMDTVRLKEQKLLAENAALERLGRLRADLLDTLSHELRTPLAVMMGYAELAVKELRIKGLGDEINGGLRRHRFRGRPPGRDGGGSKTDDPLAGGCRA